MVPYGKRNYVPAVCPQCGEGQHLATEMTLAALLDARLSWRPVLGRHPSPAFSRQPWWYGHCGKCAIFDSLGASSELWKHLRARAKQAGKSLRIPFGT